jgi:16S rRNA (guanine527-N7)-methyltransferase
MRSFMAHKNKSNWSPYKARQNTKNTSGQSSTPNSTLAGKHKKPEKIFSLEEANDRLFDLFRNHGFENFPHDKRQKLAEFYLLLMQTQNKENFTRLLNLRDIGIKHFVDSLIVAQLTSLQFPLMDVGTGPGFPGVPLKILYPNETIVLAEGVQRRVEFLKDVREKLKLEELPILGRNINPECFYPVQGVITRAVEDMRNTLGNVIHCLQTGGCVYFMKGPGVDPELNLAKEAWSEYYDLIEDKAYSLPNTPHERRLIIYKKIKSPELSDEFLESLGLPDEEE